MAIGKTSEPLEILLVEDDRDDAELIERTLAGLVHSEHALRCRLTRPGRSRGKEAA